MQGKKGGGGDREEEATLPPERFSPFPSRAVWILCRCDSPPVRLAQGGRVGLAQPASQAAVVVEDQSLPTQLCPRAGRGELAMGGGGEGFLSFRTSNNHANKMGNEPASLTAFLEF